MKEREGFLFENAAAALKFFEACIAAKANTYEERMAILRNMVKDKQATYLRDAEGHMKGQSVLDLTKLKKDTSK